MQIFAIPALRDAIVHIDIMIIVKVNAMYKTVYSMTMIVFVHLDVYLHSKETVPAKNPATHSNASTIQETVHFVIQGAHHTCWVTVNATASAILKAVFTMTSTVYASQDAHQKN
jgi:hypothetical protein